MYFITFEGIDQSGKSTQLKLLADAAAAAGVATLSVREPGGTPLGEQIREILLGPEHANMDAWTEALLYAAARVQLVREVIKPALMQGKIVLSDRYIDSSLVYQGIARELGIDRILDLNLGATGGLMPDLTFVFHLGVAASRERLAGRGTAEDRIEGEPLDFHQKVEDGYRKLEEMYPGRIAGIDAGGSIEEVHARVVEVCSERLGLEL
ncbi:MAG: dTMP kinase [Actinobacteria bacterium]|nr:dTMP kinase [Actinomycetota bacterium]